ncbi:MAG: phage baseplate assembly protein V [Candidatus Thiodiazotropha sp.]
MSAYENSFSECIETFFGLYPGVAENVVDPDGLGRITVRLPWISDTYETRFAPVAQVYAGENYGAVWLPERGDQVVIAFLKGQLSRPVVLGSIYSNTRQPVASRSDREDPKILRTKGGHYLLMEDRQSKRIELVDLTGNNSVLIDSEANSVTVRADADITIEAGGNLTLNAQTDITINAGSNITISASGQVSVSGSTINLN